MSMDRAVIFQLYDDHFQEFLGKLAGLMFSISQSAVFYTVQKSKGDCLGMIVDAEVGVILWLKWKSTVPEYKF